MPIIQINELTLQYQGVYFDCDSEKKLKLNLKMDINELLVATLQLPIRSAPLCYSWGHCRTCWHRELKTTDSALQRCRSEAFEFIKWHLFTIRNKLWNVSVEGTWVYYNSPRCYVIKTITIGENNTLTWFFFTTCDVSRSPRVILCHQTSNLVQAQSCD